MSVCTHALVRWVTTGYTDIINRDLIETSADVRYLSGRVGADDVHHSFFYILTTFILA